MRLRIIMGSDMPFSGDFLSRLERLRIAARRASLAGSEGDRAGRRKGGVVEFSGHRDYAPGDDLRYIDWNAFGRFDKLSVKEFMREDRMRVNILVDLSNSMAFGGKASFALRAAAALACIAVWGRNQAALWSVSLGGSEGPALFDCGSPPAAVVDRLSALKTGGAADIGGALRAASKSSPRGAMTAIISDFLLEEPFRDDLAAAASAGMDMAVLHVLSREESSTPRRGKVRLTDSETGERMSISVGPAMAARYDEAVREFVAGMRDFSLSRGMRYVFTLSDASVEDLLLRVLPRHGWLRQD